MNHSTLQRGMLHTAAEGETATEGDRRQGGRGAGEGDLGVGEGPGYESLLGRAVRNQLTTSYLVSALK